MNLDSAIKAYIVTEYLPGISPDELESSYDLLNTGVVDSLRLLQLICWVGDEYGIPVDEVDISPDNFRSVDAILEFIAGTSQSRGEPPDGEE